jgi:putative heme-binding domain-containing protein
VDLSQPQLKRLAGHPNAALKAKAKAVLGSYQPARRTDVVATYKSVLGMKGDSAKGKLAFAKTCAACHKVEGVGHELGPNLAAMKARGPEAILVNVLDPNAEVNPQFLNYQCDTAGGRSVTGMIAAESAAALTFVRGEGQRDTVLRADVEALKSTGLSLMPEGLEKDLPPATMADLIAYLMQVP